MITRSNAGLPLSGKKILWHGRFGSGPWWDGAKPFRVRTPCMTGLQAE